MRAGSGFTLVELVVVLLLLGLCFALVTPALFRSDPEREDAVQRVIDEARRVAVRRAEPLVLVFESDGRWAVEGNRTNGIVKVASGTAEWPYSSAARIRISAMGSCLLEAANIPDVRFDPVRCRLAETGSLR